MLLLELHVLFWLGFSRIVKLLLAHGASSALIDAQGHLYKCCEFEGVQVLIEHSQRRRAEQMVAYIKTTSSLHQLSQIWQVFIVLQSALIVYCNKVLVK